jgi:CheY-like chemotaxis protein
MYRVRLIHWNEVEAKQKVELLRSAGYLVKYDKFIPDLLRERENPPDAIIIDLSRLPSQGRDAAMALRSYKSTRTIPLILVDGKFEKVERIRAQIHDATYTGWDQIVERLTDVITHPSKDVPGPRSRLEGHAGTPLPQKLGIKPGYTVSLVGAPLGFRHALGELPEKVVLRDGVRGQTDLTLWFAKSRTELEERLQHMKAFSKNAGLWIIWPKQTSGLQTDLGQQLVREAGLAAGMVDFKICSIDPTWSGLRFTLERNRPYSNQLGTGNATTVTENQPKSLDGTVDFSIGEPSTSRKRTGRLLRHYL